MDDTSGGDASTSPPSSSRRVLVAMSGGVDSSVAVSLLKEQGWDVAGVTFKLFCYGEKGKESKACCGLEGVRDAQAVARRLGIPHTVLDLQDLFHEKVMRDFAEEYGRGRTPNPCVQCNTHVKFAPLLDWARRQGYSFIATGHYVRLRAVLVAGEMRFLLARAEDAAKDQTYVLWGVPPEVLSHTLFPLGDSSKPMARRWAQEAGLPVWDKEESQDICFVEGRSYADVVREELGPEHPLFRPGPIVDDDGTVLGVHEGLVHYTVGQRRGLQLGGGERRHVVGLDPQTNTLRVGSRESVERGGLVASRLNLFVPPAYIAEGPIEVKIRYRHEAAQGRAVVRDGRLWVCFDQPQPAVAPGQSCVIYRNGFVLGGGRIDETFDRETAQRSLSGSGVLTGFSSP